VLAAQTAVCGQFRPSLLEVSGLYCSSHFDAG
jgi:hypothetical protein